MQQEQIRLTEAEIIDTLWKLKRRIEAIEEVQDFLIDSLLKHQMTEYSLKGETKQNLYHRLRLLEEQVDSLIGLHTQEITRPTRDIDVLL